MPITPAPESISHPMPNSETLLPISFNVKKLHASGIEALRWLAVRFLLIINTNLTEEKNMYIINIWYYY